MLDTLQFNFDIFIYFHLNHLDFTTLFYLFANIAGSANLYILLLVTIGYCHMSSPVQLVLGTKSQAEILFVNLSEFAQESNE